MPSKGLQFVTHADGRKTAVIVPIEEYEEMMEDLLGARPSWPSLQFGGRDAGRSQNRRHLAH